MKLRRLLLIVTAFAIGMAFLESAVVVYLREILYPGGFDFPLRPISAHLALTELLREVATLVMLLTTGMLGARSMASPAGAEPGSRNSGRSRFSPGFAWFLYIFAIWDIFYYVWLKALMDWPQSWWEWDVLFLIPTVWLGPWVSPVLIALLFTIWGGAVLSTRRAVALTPRTGYRPSFSSSATSSGRRVLWPAARLDMPTMWTSFSTAWRAVSSGVWNSGPMSTSKPRSA